jgi:predicted N-acetyltransferase YhbS
VIEVREEEPEDRDAVRRVEQAAFGRDDEADIVDALRTDPAWALSLVAVADDGEIVGHLLFTRGDRAMTLGPLAVAPEHQRSGVGGALMREGLARIDEPIVLLGHVDYYPRFGFRPAAPLGITNQWGIDDPAWMVRGELEPGPVRYPAAFAP